MAFNSFNNQQQNNQQKPETYTGYDVSNLDGVDPSKLGYKYWSNNLEISITPVTSDSTKDNVKFDYKNKGAIVLTHQNARLFYHAIKEWLKDPNGAHNVCVSTRRGIIVGLSDGEEFESGGKLCLFIRKVNATTGKPDSTFVYTFRTDYSYIVGYDATNGKFKKEFRPSIEVEELLSMLNNYYEAMTYSVAYSVKVAMGGGLSSKLDRIMEKLGVNTGNGGGGYSKGNSYFNSSSNAVTEQSLNENTNAFTGTLDDLDDSLPFD